MMIIHAVHLFQGTWKVQILSVASDTKISVQLSCCLHTLQLKQDDVKNNQPHKVLKHFRLSTPSPNTHNPMICIECVSGLDLYGDLLVTKQTKAYFLLSCCLLEEVTRLKWSSLTIGTHPKGRSPPISCPVSHSSSLGTAGCRST